MTPVLLLLRRFTGILLIIAGVAALITAIVAPRFSVGVDIAMPLTIPVPSRPPTSEYEYDGFYALQATDLFADTLAGWLSSPDFVAEVYRRAGLIAPASSIRHLGKLFRARKISGQLVELKFHAASKEEAMTLTEEIKSLMEERISRFNKEGRSSLSFSVVAGEPLIIPVKQNTLTKALVAGLVTFVLGVNFVIFRDAMRSERDKR